jgi:hypothetical protein
VYPLGERGVLAIYANRHDGLPVRGDVEALDGADRRSVELVLVALDELVAVLEVGLDGLPTAAPEDDEANEDRGSNDCRYGGNPSNPAYRSHDCLVSPPEDTRRSPAVDGRPLPTGGAGMYLSNGRAAQVF